MLILDPLDRVLYLHAREQRSRRQFWVLPGGGLEAGGTFEEAAVRETCEETGLVLSAIACLWTRHHVYEWEGRSHNQFEVFFLGRTDDTEIRPASPDSYIFDHRWWSLPELRASNESFAPTGIARLLDPVLKGSLPQTPIDCGV
jgi:8-oxo-dGTP pyrophosphatase MutT (NUDIX family)